MECSSSPVILWKPKVKGTNWSADAWLIYSITELSLDGFPFCFCKFCLFVCVLFVGLVFIFNLGISRTWNHCDLSLQVSPSKFQWIYISGLEGFHVIKYQEHQKQRRINYICLYEITTLASAWQGHPTNYGLLRADLSAFVSECMALVHYWEILN